ncbi:uncharacterized protein [Rutidosis leptorrhynchoides]|uniref:uncharacterized protein n=1 Tax=Rutidosis leptorrhynchoides TaxID=125765 RepID=UPI003A994186
MVVAVSNRKWTLWVNIIKSIYGMDGGLGCNTNISVLRYSTAWRNIIKIGEELEKIGLNFNNLFVRTIGDGQDTRFWMDEWAGNFKLCDKYPRLFRLERKSDVFINERVTFSNGIWTFAWDWSRGLTGRLHGELEQVTSMVKSSINLQEGGSKWSFKMGASDETLRNNLIPQKIGIFVWRVMKGRIPVKVELDKTGIDLDTLLCPMCNDIVESVNHAILECKHAKEVWDGVFKWWNLPSPRNTSVVDWFSSRSSSGVSSVQMKMWQAIIWTTSYLIWKNRNQKTFQNVAWASAKIVNEVQTKAFEWIINRSRNLHYEWHQWLLNPTNLGFPLRNNLDPG